MKRESKVTILMIVGLLIVSLGLWSYQTFVLPKQEALNYKVVYVASTDIPTNATLTADMVEPIKVADDSVLPGAVTNISEVEGTRVTGGVLEGEAIFEQRLSEDLMEEGEFYVRAEPDYAVDLEDGEHVRVLVQNEQGIAELFSRKQVYATSRITNVLEGESATGFYLLLTEDELKAYYQSKNTGQIILTKIDTVAKLEGDESLVSKPSAVALEGAKKVEKEQADKEPSEKNDNNEQEVQSNRRYTVKEDQSLEDIAYELETTTDVLSELNNGKTEVSEGDIIAIP